MWVNKIFSEKLKLLTAMEGGTIKINLNDFLKKDYRFLFNLIQHYVSFERHNKLCIWP